MPLDDSPYATNSHLNEAGVNEVIAATLKSEREGKCAEVEKFCLHNSLLPCKQCQNCSQQEGAFYYSTTGTSKTGICL